MTNFEYSYPNGITVTLAEVAAAFRAGAITRHQHFAITRHSYYEMPEPTAEAAAAAAKVRTWIDRDKAAREAAWADARRQLKPLTSIKAMVDFAEKRGFFYPREAMYMRRTAKSPEYVLAAVKSLLLDEDLRAQAKRRWLYEIGAL